MFLLYVYSIFSVSRKIFKLYKIELLLTFLILEKLVAYWDRDSCDPMGDNKNWIWCDTNGGGPCQREVVTDQCSSGIATLQAVHGEELAMTYTDQYELDGCQYTYYAEYACKGMISHH